METPGLIFDLEWKKRDSIVGRNDDVASIGIWDTSETSLNLLRFKSYLSQSLGTPEDISFAFVDSDGDEIEIDNEYDFVKALKFARKRALKGQRITLRVEKLLTENNIISSTTEDSLRAVVAKLTMVGQDCRKEKSQNQGAKPDGNPKLECCIDDRSESNPPLWFKKYMQKLKSDLVAEVTGQVILAIEGICDRNKDNCKCLHKHVFNEESKAAACDVESSDADVRTEIRDSKLLRKIEKLQKREKKLERKLESKIEKLENKTRKMLEKKSQTKPRARAPEKISSSRKVPHMSVATYLMDAVLVGDCDKPEKYVKCGERFTKTWEVLNCGTLPWTDKTDLRLTWGSDGLIPDERIVKCPILEPGETGKITINFQAPDVPGTFESYWHFYHMGERFGHWIHCNVITDQKSNGKNGLTKCSSEENLESYNIVKPLDTVKSDNYNMQTRGPEYDSDSDNISIISATASQSSDSEMEINEFVLVPGSTAPEHIPSFVEQTSLETKVKPPETNSDTFSSIQTSERFSSNSLSKQSSSCSINGSKLSKNVIDYDNNKPHLEVADSALNDTFLKLTVGEDLQAKENDSSTGPESSATHEKFCRQQSQSSDSSIHSLHSSPTRTDHFNRIKFDGGAKKVIYAVNKNGCSIPVEVLQSKHDGNATAYCSSSSENSEPMNRNSTRQFNHVCPNSNGESSDIIHILPETLVNGAVNVATSALSRAKAVISNLTTIPIGDVRTEFSESLSSEMKQLIEMGFINKRLNEVLLNRYGNDVTKVVAELVSLEETLST